LIFVSKTLVFIDTVLAPSNPLTLRLMAFLPSPSPSSPASSASTILKSMSFWQFLSSSGTIKGKNYLKSSFRQTQI
jgi:hypothetical protein